MNLIINSPAYYTQKNGVIDDIYQLCSLISHKIDITNYTKSLDIIGITPIIAPVQIINEGKCKEVKLISLQYRMASISLISDYEIFYNADMPLKKIIILENIFKSLAVIKKRIRSQFDYDKMVSDIKKLVSVTENS